MDDTIPIILLLYILDTETCVIHDVLIDKLDASFGVQDVDVCGNGVDDQAQSAFVGLQHLLSAFAIFDVEIDSKPSGDVSSCVANGTRPESKPPIGAIVAAHPCFRVRGDAGDHARSPIVANSLAVVRMNSLDPAEVRGLLRRQTRVVEPISIEELGATIRKRGPGQARKRVDEMREFEWH